MELEANSAIVIGDSVTWLVTVTGICAKPCCAHIKDENAAAIRRGCLPVRAIRFISVTGLVPALTPRNPLPFFEDIHGFQRKIPNGDHTRFWKDPISGHHVITDEPYLGEATPPLVKAKRTEWANKHQLSAGFPEWPGMHNPGYGTRLTLFSQNLNVATFVSALDKLPVPGEGYDADLLEPDFQKAYINPFW